MTTAKTKLNIGVIGAGSISGAHLDAYAACPDAVLIAVCDLNEERAQEKATKYGAAKVYTDYRELLADPAIDAVSICTWNNSHAEISIAALQAGKHVLCEKPLCRTVEEALRVEAAVERVGQGAAGRVRPPVCLAIRHSKAVHRCRRSW